MCGIFGYVGKDLPLLKILEGLARLEYRGYDSCGIAVLKGEDFFLKKQAGKISQLRGVLVNRLIEEFPLAVAHTRWATHGQPNHLNAHPHQDCTKGIVVVHNGIIENYLELKKRLIKQGHTFLSQTDTEVVAHLLEVFYRGSLEEAVFKTLRELRGSFALGIIFRFLNDLLIGVRKGSPLIIGLAREGNFLASDIPALLPFTQEVVYLKDEQLAFIRKDKIELFNFERRPIPFRKERMSSSPL